MKAFIKKYSIYILLGFIVGALASSLFNGFTEKKDQPVPQMKTESEFMLGTIIRISVYDDVTDDQFADMFSIIRDIENHVSKNISSSEISLINKNAGIEPVEVSERTFQLIKDGLYHGDLSNGWFDISIGPLTNLWDIGSTNAHLPSQEEIDDALTYVDYTDVILDESKHTVYLPEKSMSLDLGGIAKGFVADEIAVYMKANGIDHGIINLGGNVLTVGSKYDGSNWKIGIQDPFSDRGGYLGVIELDDQSIVTSGIYERFFEEDGIRYHHILSPFNGYPINNELASISIISESSMEGDSLSTTIFALGLEEGLALAENLEDVEAIFVTTDYEVYTTSGVKDIFTLEDNAYTLMN